MLVYIFVVLEFSTWIQSQSQDGYDNNCNGIQQESLPGLAICTVQQSSSVSSVDVQENRQLVDQYR